MGFSHLDRQADGDAGGADLLAKISRRDSAALADFHRRDIGADRAEIVGDGFGKQRAGLIGGALLPAPAARAAPAPQRGGAISLLLAAEPPTLSLIANTAYNTVLVSPKAQGGLLTYDFALNPQSQLATSWSISPDGLKYAFALRSNVKWHAGADFTSGDVAFSIESLKAVHPRAAPHFSA